MSIEVQNVQRLRVWTEGTFATDGTGTLANYTDVPFIEGGLTAVLTQDMLNPEHAQQHIDGYPTQLLGRKACTLSFSMNLAPTGTAAGDSVQQVQSALGQILAAVMGGESQQTGDTVQASPGPTTTVFAVAAAVANNLQGANLIGLLSADDGTLEARFIEDRSSNTLTLKLALSNAPSSSDIVYGGINYYLDQDPTATLQFIVEGAEQDDRWLLLGMQLDSMTIDLPLNQLPRITFSLKGVQWLHGDDTAGVLTGSALGRATYANVSPVHVDGEFLVQTVGTSTRPTPTCISQLSISPNLQYAEVPCPSGTNGVARWRRVRNAPVVTGSFRTQYQDESDFDTRDAKTLKMLSLQMGNAAGSTVLLELPSVQYTDVQRLDDGGVAGHEVSFAAQLDGDIGTGASDRLDSAMRLGFV